MNVAVVGTGYVGLVTGACLADLEHDVVCVDLDPERIATVRGGRSPIHEEGLEALIERHVGRRLGATTDLHEAIREADVAFIAVGTPFDGDELDLGAVIAASRGIGSVLADGRYRVVVVKSTVMPGTTDLVVLGELEPCLSPAPRRPQTVRSRPLGSRDPLHTLGARSPRRNRRTGVRPLPRPVVAGRVGPSRILRRKESS